MRRHPATPQTGFIQGQRILRRSATACSAKPPRQWTAPCNWPPSHRKERKRDYRGLWIIRVNAACKLCGISYNRLIEGLRKADIRLNRKMLAEIAIHDEAGFARIVEQGQGRAGLKLLS